MVPVLAVGSRRRARLAAMVASRKRDGRAARAVVRKHFQSLGLMLEFVSRTRRKPAQVLSLVLRPRGAMR